jgi:hypothetical protein
MTDNAEGAWFIVACTYIPISAEQRKHKWLGWKEIFSEKTVGETEGTGGGEQSWA